MLSLQTYIDVLTSGMLGSLQLGFLAKQKQNHIMISVWMKNGIKYVHSEESMADGISKESVK